MNQDTGRFEPIPAGSSKELFDHVVSRCEEARRRVNPQEADHSEKPVLSPGEVLSIKGILFRVIRIKLDGRLTLKMLNKADIEEQAKNPQGIIRPGPGDVVRAIEDSKEEATQ